MVLRERCHCTPWPLHGGHLRTPFRCLGAEKRQLCNMQVNRGGGGGGWLDRDMGRQTPQITNLKEWRDTSLGTTVAVSVELEQKSGDACVPFPASHKQRRLAVIVWSLHLHRQRNHTHAHAHTCTYRHTCERANTPMHTQTQTKKCVMLK